MNKKIQNIQALRGIAVLSVIFYHNWLYENKFVIGGNIFPKLFQLGYLGVDLFFVISGFIMVVVTRGTFQKKGVISSFLYNRISRIYPLYWFYSLILITAYFLLGTPTDKLAVNLKTFFLVPQEKFPVLDVGWTLIYEIYFYLIFSILLLAAEKHLKILLFLWLFLVTVTNIFFYFISLPVKNPILQHLVSPFTIEFIEGCLIALLLYRNLKLNALCVFFAGVVLLLIGLSVYSVENNLWLRIILVGTPFSILLYGSVKIEADYSLSFPKIFRVIGDSSYSIYLSHTLVIMTIARIWKLFSFPEAWNDILIYSCIISASILYGIFSYHYIEIPTLTFSKNVPHFLKRIYKSKKI